MLLCQYYIINICWMEPDAEKCQKCNNLVLSQCMEIHKIMCRSKKRQEIKFSKIKSSDLKEQDADLIPCVECGEMVPFNLYSEHENECIDKQTKKCFKCGLNYPNYLMNEHIQICQGNWANNNEEPSDINEDLYDEQQYEEEQINQEIYLNESNEQQPENPFHNIQVLIGSLALIDQQEGQVGLTQDQLKLLKRVNKGKNQQCSVCCVSMLDKKSNIQLNCKHVFHSICIEAWLLKNPRCPMCRKHCLKV